MDDGLGLLLSYITALGIIVLGFFSAYQYFKYPKIKKSNLNNFEQWSAELNTPETLELLADFAPQKNGYFREKDGKAPVFVESLDLKNINVELEGEMTPEFLQTCKDVDREIGEMYDERDNSVALVLGGFQQIAPYSMRSFYSYGETRKFNLTLKSKRMLPLQKYVLQKLVMELYIAHHTNLVQTGLVQNPLARINDEFDTDDIYEISDEAEGAFFAIIQSIVLAIYSTHYPFIRKKDYENFYHEFLIKRLEGFDNLYQLNPKDFNHGAVKQLEELVLESERKLSKNR